MIVVLLRYIVKQLFLFIRCNIIKTAISAVHVFQILASLVAHLDTSCWTVTAFRVSNYIKYEYKYQRVFSFAWMSQKLRWALLKKICRRCCYRCCRNLLKSVGKGDSRGFFSTEGSLFFPVLTKVTWQNLLKTFWNLPQNHLDNFN